MSLASCLRWTRALTRFVCLLELFPVAAGAVEPWASSPLPVQAGLELWLDAGAIPAARDAVAAGKLADGDSLDRWPDASGRERDFAVSHAEREPKLVRIGEAWVVRFDGENDHLRCVSDAGEWSATTLFIVAAPHANPGDFRGFFATNAPGARDYQSGLTLDLGPGPTREFDQLNVEGRGFGGARDLLNDGSPFGTLHILEATVDPVAQEVRLRIDGKPQGTRPFAAAGFSRQELTVGARYYNNGPGDQRVAGPIAADIAEVIAFDRVLDDAEAEAVRAYLTEKHAALAKVIPEHVPVEKPTGVPLVKAEHPPPIQMLVPGFAVEELPVELTNVNNVRYREDGVLVTLGYNGDVHLLRDTDGDGREDRADLFWKNEGSIRGPIGIALTPPGYERGRGLFVSSKGKVSLIVDTTGDDRADEEIVVASGWNEIPQNVDAVGLTLDAEGNLYFGLGTANFANAYLVNEQGEAAYDLASDRGTVQKVSADFSRRETVCTGIRFPIAFGFNDQGDLFCTEQEGATWLANGNPFDELLHVQAGRHYGFPPRHPRHNPDVLDEPSTFDFGPQHQSTCGMVFNAPVNDGPVFGPSWWAGDALICGESRGKIWRTKLVKSRVGYVAESQLIACLQMLTVDACVSPRGDLVAACHSGPPDWGTGPTGTGKLFRIRMTRPEVPRPVAVWAESSQEVRITFDRSLDPVALRDLAGRMRIEYGRYVRAGDRFENLAPPYAVVQRQSLEPRFELPVVGASIMSDLRTVVINTAPMRADVRYAVILPDPAGAAAGDVESDRTHPQTEVDFALRGIVAERHDVDGKLVWSGWLPHLDLEVSRGLLAESEYHRPLWDGLEQPGTLTLHTQVDLHDILRPAIQPGSTLDYEWPDELATLVVSAGQPFEASSVEGVTIERLDREGQGEVRLSASSDRAGPAPLTLRLPTGEGEIAALTCAVATNEDSRPRPLPLRRFLLPWVDPTVTSSDGEAPALVIAELDGGSWGRGRRVFRSEQAGCFKCHALQGDSAAIGPDLNNLVHRDYASVRRDVLNPSFAINPDYIGHVIVLDDGRTLTGVLRNQDGKLWLGDEKGKVTEIDRDAIDSMQPAKTSIMPQGLLDKLSPDEVRDLMTYLLTPPPHMPLDSPLDAPPLRTPAEVAAALAGSQL
ncbi:MAG: c-type cytochrome, partial [Planctomycetaceae bacterium]|nr:c-type cytochrome [Planctomycetaceae bacterium]